MARNPAEAKTRAPYPIFWDRFTPYGLLACTENAPKLPDRTRQRQSLAPAAARLAPYWTPCMSISSRIGIGPLANAATPSKLTLDGQAAILDFHFHFLRRGEIGERPWS